VSRAKSKPRRRRRAVASGRTLEAEWSALAPRSPGSRGAKVPVPSGDSRDDPAAWERFLAHEGMPAEPALIDRATHSLRRNRHFEDNLGLLEADGSNTVAYQAAMYIDDVCNRILHEVQLAERERLVLELYKEGHGVPAIASRLKVGAKAVRLDLQRMKTRYGLVLRRKARR
jgi:hypothetical protein